MASGDPDRAVQTHRSVDVCWAHYLIIEYEWFSHFHILMKRASFYLWGTFKNGWRKRGRSRKWITTDLHLQSCFRASRHLSFISKDCSTSLHGSLSICIWFIFYLRFSLFSLPSFPFILSWCLWIWGSTGRSWKKSNAQYGISKLST